jgi:hypothetical protein
MSAQLAELQKQIDALQTQVAMMPDYGARLAEMKKISPFANGFSAHKNGTAQSVTALTATKLTFGTEYFDLNGEYDAATSIYTPKRAGVYWITGAAFNQASVAQDYLMVRLYKNGAQVANGGVLHASQTGAIGISGAFLQQANGTTDYFEIYTYISRTQNIEGTAGTTGFAGAWVGPLTN